VDDLTNYVYLITNYWGFYNNKGLMTRSGKNGYSMAGSTIPSIWPQGTVFYPITNGMRIVGLLSTPEYTDGIMPITNLLSGGYSNHVVAYVRSMSGLAAEKPPQNNTIMQEATFAYHLLCVNAPLAADNGMLQQSGFAREISGNLRELRLLFMWPQHPDGSVGGFRQNFRATMGGQMLVTNDSVISQKLYFYESESFTNAP